MPPLSIQDARHVFSQYRRCLREVRQLPHVYLQRFYKLKARDDVEGVLQCPKRGIHVVRLERFVKLTKKLGAANQGHVKPFQHILDLAYGRKGRLKWEFLEPLIAEAKNTSKPRIIPNVESSRPPEYSPALIALLTCSGAKSKGKALKPGAWTREKLLPPRADPATEEARLLGPFSKRREVNVQWRYFKKQSQSIYPPLEVLPEDDQADAPANDEITPSAVPDFGLVEHIHALVGPSPRPPLTRKERLQGVPSPPPTHRHPSLWVRRRYRELLERLPLLKSTTTKEAGKPRRYEAEISHQSLGVYAMREVDEETLQWLKADLDKANAKAVTNKGKKSAKITT